MTINAKVFLALAVAAVVAAASATLIQAKHKAACDSEAEDSAADSSYEAELKQSAAQRGKDPTWKASTTEVALIQTGDGKRGGQLQSFCVNTDGNLLACVGKSVRVYSPEGKLLQTFEMPIAPTTVARAAGHIFVAGEGKLLKLDASGKVLATTESPVAKMPIVINSEMEEMVRQQIKQTKQPFDKALAQMKTGLESRRAAVTGLAATEQDVFMVVGSPTDFSYRVYRFDHALANPKLVVEKLRGCCSQMDLQAHDGNLWIPHNGRHAVESRDRDGKELTKFGKAGRVKPEDFGGGCEPKNMRVLPDGDILVAESGPPTCIKRLSPAGKLLEVVAVVETKGDCVRVVVDRSPDGSRYYLMDTTRDAIRVFKAKG